MSKKIFLVPLMIFLLLSCNFPLFQRSDQIDENDVSTRVAQTLQAAGTTTVTGSPSELAAATETATPNPTGTSTVTPTVTTSPDDPRLTLGSPTFTDSFTTGSAFGLKTPYSDGVMTMSVADGVLRMQSTGIDGGTRWRLAYLTPRNLYLEGTFKTISCSGSDFYGLVFRSPDYSSGIGYYYAISCGGQYSLMRMNGDFDMVKIIDWTADPAILAGAGQENRIGVLATDTHFTLYVNGKKVAETDNEVLKDKGHYGVFQTAQQTSNMTVEVEEINEWDRP